MIDLHSHLLFETDDGARTIEESLEMIKSAEKNGIDIICLTPHYIIPEYIINKNENLRKLEELKKELKKQKIEIQLYLGNEIFISDETIYNLSNNNISSLGNSEYLLIELPMDSKVKYLKEMLENIIDNNYKIIIAHPERYTFVQENTDYFNKIIENGNIYLQGNYGSILGNYGDKAQKTIIKLLKEKKIHILASDIHTKDIYSKIPELKQKLKKIITKEYIDELTEINPRKILINEAIQVKKSNKKNIFCKIMLK